jgi:hypothetical protein
VVRARLTLMAVIARLAATETLPRVAPLWLAIALFAAVAFGGNGMHPRTVIRAMDASLAARAALWLAWVSAVRASVAAGLRARGLGPLGALPVGHGLRAAPHALVAVAAQLPWAVLFAFGAGAARAIAAVATAAGLALVGGRWPRRLVEGAARAALVAVALGPPSVMPPWGAAIVGAAALAIAAETAVRWAPDHDAGARRARLLRGRAAAVVLGAAHLVTLRRGYQAGLARAALVVALLAAVSGLAAANNHLSAATALGRVSLALASASAALAAGGAALFLVRAERQARWLLDATGTGEAVRARALMLAGAVVGALAATLHASLLAAMGRARGEAARASAAFVIVAAAAHLVAGAAAGALAAQAARGAFVLDEIDEGRLAARMGLVVLGGALAAALAGLVAAPLLAATALGAAWRARAAERSLA